MARDHAIGAYVRIENKYGGWKGLMKASLEGTLDVKDYKDYMEASRTLGLG